MKRLLLAGVFLGAFVSVSLAQIPPLTLYPTTADVVLGTPCGSAGTPLWRSICSSDMTAVFGTANTWTALQTFSGGIALPSQTANTFLAAPNGSSGAPSFRAVVAADINTALTAPGPIGSTTANAGTFTTVKASLRVDTSSAPAASSCGTSPSVASGSANSAGQFTLGSSAPTNPACTITFANSGWPTNAWCSVTPDSDPGSGNRYWVSAQSKTSFSISSSAALSGVSFSYTCSGN